MASPTSSTLHRPLSSAENNIVTTSVSQIPGWSLQMTARATVLSNQMLQNGALALLRETSTNRLAMMLLSTTHGDPLWFQTVTPESRLQRIDGPSCHSYHLNVTEADESVEIIFDDGQEEVAELIIKSVNNPKAFRRLTKRTGRREELETSADDELVSSPQEITGDIRQMPKINEAVSAPGTRIRAFVSATGAGVEKRRNTVPLVRQLLQGSDGHSDSRRTDTTGKVEHWLEHMPISSPTLTSAPPKIGNHPPTGEDIAPDEVVDARISSYPGALSPTRSGSWHMRFPTLRKRRRGPWKATIGGKAHEIPDVTSDLTDISATPKDDGGFGTIRQGKLNGEGVAIKQIKLSSSRSFFEKIKMKESKRFQTEVVIAMLCARMQHPNIMKFKGVAITGKLGACLVFPWMENGNSLDYIRDNPYVPRFPIIYGTLKGLEYMHRRHFVHGDMKAHNILISDEGTPLISDFGLTANDELLDEQPSTSIQRAGNARWKAPELLEDEFAKRTQKSDMWAFGMFVIEILTGELPFPDATTPTITVAVHKNELPERPAHPECSHELWSTIDGCWERCPEDRISAKKALRKLGKLDGSGCSSSKDGSVVVE
ncbi:hypothetical protein ACEPAF_5831 [Sanghuangporus sanghuang]